MKVRIKLSKMSVNNWVLLSSQGYMRPLKQPDSSSIVDPLLVDEMFYQIPEILEHHEHFLEQVAGCVSQWHDRQTVGHILIQSVSRDDDKLFKTCLLQGQRWKPNILDFWRLLILSLAELVWLWGSISSRRSALTFPHWSLLSSTPKHEAWSEHISDYNRFGFIMAGSDP